MSKLEYEYNLLGGSLTSIKVNGVEHLYQPDPRSWGGQDVVIFPFVARLKDQTYTVDGKEYSMKNHGLARYNKFSVVSESDESSTILFQSNEETLKQYPYRFKLYVTYTKNDDDLSLKVNYRVVNIEEKPIYFGLGGHPALKVDYIETDTEHDTSGNYLIFDEELDLDYYELVDNYSFVGERKHLGKVKQFELNKDFFRKWNTLLLDAKDIHNVTLLRKNGEKILYHFDNIKYLALWSFPQYGDYVCVEPWVSVPDFKDGDKELPKKKTLIKLDSGKEYEMSYEIKFR